jgi:hypothetical protein
MQKDAVMEVKKLLFDGMEQERTAGIPIYNPKEDTMPFHTAISGLGH